MDKNTIKIPMRRASDLRCNLQKYGDVLVLKNLSPDDMRRARDRAYHYGRYHGIAIHTRQVGRDLMIYHGGMAHDSN